MSILVNKDSRIVVQGITGRDGSFHSQGMLDYGTPLVAVVNEAFTRKFNLDPPCSRKFLNIGLRGPETVNPSTKDLKRPVNSITNLV